MNLRLFFVCWLVGPAVLFAQPAAGPRARDSKIDPAFVVAHETALRQARVWFRPSTPIGAADLAVTGSAPDGFTPDAVVACAFRVEGVAGSTPKFVCELPDGDTIKVKYGSANAEVYTEVLATRLLGALGFPSDRMYPVARVRCFGCPADPFKDLQCLNEGTSKEQCFPHVDHLKAVDFDHAVIERSLEGRRIETARERGWAWQELVKVDASANGSPLAEVDALRLLAVFLGHWDNKAKNQRLLCLGEPESDAPITGTMKCDRPVAMVQDVGATFGPDKLNLEKWTATPIWTNAASCMVSMRTLPYGGSTFGDWRISEAGRVFLADLLRQLSREQIRGLFTGARVTAYPRATAAARVVDNWVAAFQTKVNAIVNRSPCP